ncbi:MAG: TetR/AcrR family transcriptional regulator [Oscillospiraceae bacterium]
MNTKEMIVESARLLFNELGSTNVSTKLIASQMGISPGNLYYHFHNKEEIIRKIYDQISLAMDELFFDFSDGLFEEGIAKFYLKLIKIQKHYCFFYRELSILVSNDAELRATYRTRSERIISQFINIYDQWVMLKIMKPFKSCEERDTLAANAWTLGQLWITHADILYDYIPSEVNYQEILRVHALMRPYFTAKSNKKLERLLNKEWA